MNLKVYQVLFTWSFIFLTIGCFRYFFFEEKIQITYCFFISIAFLVSALTYHFFEEKKKPLNPILGKIHVGLAIPSAVLFVMFYFELQGMFVPKRFYTEPDMIYPNFTYKRQILSIMVTVSALSFGISFLFFLANIFTGIFKNKTGEAF